ncbi:DUF3450 domain-containing protein [Desulfobotulus sp. H1]|uniref:DUF3450 domain-containing protein n=1 Tax=Desulfobotulus pelophilus TaxID=2823377 RepID=A0ABT3N8X8_9BACT|nr:DUF3450 domain-containing protein [Desulfobotulus pelophilus]MCW7753899.1 DUF3450 domain-containing protein [Desulfobotulus pelophilus]
MVIKKSVMAGFLVLLLHAPGFVMGDSRPKAVMEEHEKGMEAEAGTQKAREAWARERRELLSRMESLEEENRRLGRDRDRLSRSRDHLERDVAAIERELMEARRLEDELDGRLDEVLLRLEGSMASDLPFLEEERTQRLAMLQDLMVDPDAGPAERLRRIMEALRIEADYGFTVELGRIPLQLGQDEVLAQVLRLGRLGLFYRTGDGRVGYYDAGEKRWQPLEASWDASFARAFDVATRKRAPELVTLPVGRILP